MSKKAPACRCKKAECEECPEWIFTFADLVMLMMGFFVILWVLKPAATKASAAADPQSNTEWVKAAAAIREAFGYVPNTRDPSDPVEQQVLQDRMSARVGPNRAAKSTVRPDGAVGTDPETTAIRTGKTVVIGGRLPFARGDGKLDDGLHGKLDEIADQIRGHRQIVVVKGHASLDDLPDNAPPTAAMDLSLRRAQAAADYLVGKGVSPDILRVEGCGTFEPVVQREYTPDVQAGNRRVEVEVTPTPVSNLQGTGFEGR